MSKSKVVVTGGAGFIGSNLVDRLLNDGHSVTVIDNLSTGRLSNLDDALKNGAELKQLDITDADNLQLAINEVQPDLIFHLAAQIDVRRSTTETAFDATVNVVGTINTLEAARKADVKRLVFVSTGGAIYGESELIPAPETAAINPLAPYGQSKYAGEGYCHLYTRLHGLSTVCLRLGNVYGPRQDPLGEAGVIAIFCGKLKDGEAPQIFGDGTQTRDYVYVDDVVAAMLAASQSSSNGSFNIGSGVESSVLDLVDCLKRLSDGEFLDPVLQPARPGEVQRSALDASKAASEFGWQAQIGLEAGIKQTLEFMP